MIRDQLQTDRGLALMIDDRDAAITARLLQTTGLSCVLLQSDPQSALRLRARFQDQRLYGHRVVIWDWPEAKRLPFAGLRNRGFGRYGFACLPG